MFKWALGIFVFVLETSFKFSYHTMALLKPQLMVANVETFYWIAFADVCHFFVSGLVMLYAAKYVHFFGGLRRMAIYCLIMRCTAHFCLALSDAMHSPYDEWDTAPFSPFPTLLVWLVHAFAHVGPLQSYLLLAVLNHHMPASLEANAKNEDSHGKFQGFTSFFMEFAVFHVATTLAGTTLATFFASLIDIESIGPVHWVSAVLLFFCVLFAIAFARITDTDPDCLELEKQVAASAVEINSRKIFSISAPPETKSRSPFRALISPWYIFALVLILCKAARIYIHLVLPFQFFYQTFMETPKFHMLSLQFTWLFELVGLVACFVAKTFILKRADLNTNYLKLQRCIAVWLLLLAPMVWSIGSDLTQINDSVFESSFIVYYCLASGVFLFVEAGIIWLLLTTFDANGQQQPQRLLQTPSLPPLQSTPQMAAQLLKIIGTANIGVSIMVLGYSFIMPIHSYYVSSRQSIGFSCLLLFAGGALWKLTAKVKSPTSSTSSHHHSSAATSTIRPTATVTID